MPKKPRGMLTVGEAAERLGVHPNTLRAWADRGLIKHVRLPSGYRRFPVSEVERLRQEMGFDEVEGKAAA